MTIATLCRNHFQYLLCLSIEAMIKHARFVGFSYECRPICNFMNIIFRLKSAYVK
jgi:hypothetical protein